MIRHIERQNLQCVYNETDIEAGVASRGRNGYFKAGGYDVTHLTLTDEVMVRALTSNRVLSEACCIRVPTKDWVGTALEKLLDALQADKKLPAYMNLHPLLDEMIAHRLHTSE